MSVFNKFKFFQVESRTYQKLSGAIAFLAGILMGLTTAPVNAWLLAWVALVPLWILVVTYQKPEREGNSQKFLFLPFSLFFLPYSFFLFPLLWGIGYHGLALSWIMGIHPMTWLGVPWWPSLAIALFCWAFITLWGAALVTVWAGLFAIAIPQTKGSRPSIIRVLIGTALWCALEGFWSQGSLWWTSLSYTQSPHNLPILHLGQLSGPTAVTAAIVAVNGLIAEAYIGGKRQQEEGRHDTDYDTDTRMNYRVLRFFQQFGRKKEGGRDQKEEVRKNEEEARRKEEGRGKREEGNGKKWIDFIWPIVLCFILHIVGWKLYDRPLIQLPETALKIGIIQGNIPNEIKFDSAGWRRALEGYTAGYQQLVDRGVDAVLTPETSLPFFWTNEYQRSTLAFYQAILDRGVTAFVGGFGQQENSITNSLFALDKTGEIVSRYDKTKLVPLGEYIPFYEILGGIIDRLSPLDAHLIPGNSKQLFDTPFGRAIVGICYDSAFAEIFRYQAANGGEFMLTASNNAHYKPPMLAQHHALDVMRSIETDRWAAIATNTGYSAFVNPHGETVWMSGINTYEVRDAVIYRRQTQTLYVRWGDWLMPVLLIAAGLGAIEGRRDERRRKKE